MSLILTSEEADYWVWPPGAKGIPVRDTTPSLYNAFLDEIKEIHRRREQGIRTTRRYPRLHTDEELTPFNRAVLNNMPIPDTERSVTVEILHNGNLIHRSFGAESIQEIMDIIGRFNDPRYQVRLLEVLVNEEFIRALDILEFGDVANWFHNLP